MDNNTNKMLLKSFFDLININKSINKSHTTYFFAKYGLKILKDFMTILQKNPKQNLRKNKWFILYEIRLQKTNIKIFTLFKLFQNNTLKTNIYQYFLY